MAQIPKNESFDTGSNYPFIDKMIPPNSPRSKFDLSHLSTLTIPNAGMVFPITILETLPRDDFSISVQSLIRVMPQVVPLYSRQRLYTYAFWCRNSDLWKNWQVFMKRGLSGNVVKTIPTLNSDNTQLLGKTNKTILADSLGDYFGLPQGANIEYLRSGTANAVPVSALPMMMYLKIWRDYFCNRNEFINDRVLFPDDDSDFRLNDDGNIISAADNNAQVVWDVVGNFDSIHYRKSDGTAGEFFGDEDDTPDANYKYLSVSRFYHDYAPDRFTTAVPWQQRGNVDRATISLSGDFAYTIPALDLDSTQSKATWTDFGLMYGANDISTGKGQAFVVNAGNTVPISTNLLPGGTEPGDIGMWHNMILSLNSNQFVSGKTLSTDGTGTLTGASFNLNDLRNIMIAQTEMEKMARTDGSYAEFGETFFGEASKAAYDYKPYFVGGTYTNLIFSEVLQTSQSTTGTDGKALGTMAGHGIGANANDNDFIGNFHCDDYGYLMILGCIMPDTYYSQGIDKLWTRSLQVDFYLPERSRLGMQPIYNYELYLRSGAITTGSEQTTDNEYVWAYNDPFDELRSMPNRIHGKIADLNNKSFSPFTQSRKFTQLPVWGREFSEADDVRKDYLAAPTEDAYSAQFDVNITAVRCLPFKAIPALFA